MIIAWTSAFHAYFFKNKIKPYYKEGNKYKRRDGDFDYWQLATCIDEYKGQSLDSATIANLKLFIPLRNHIEHKQLKEIDANLFGECQSLLLNFDRFIELEFGGEHCIRESLAFALQLFPGSGTLSDALRHNPATKPAIELLQNYRSSLSQEVYQSDRYAFKAFLIKVANHQSRDSVPIQFINYNDLTPEEQASFSGFVTLIKTKEVAVANSGLFKAGDVVKALQDTFGNKTKKVGRRDVQVINFDTHTRLWKKYEARPITGSQNPENTKIKWCTYDAVHKDYMYTKDWVNFITEKLRNEDEMKSLYTKSATASL